MILQYNQKTKHQLEVLFHHQRINKEINLVLQTKKLKLCYLKFQVYKNKQEVKSNKAGNKEVKNHNRVKKITNKLKVIKMRILNCREIQKTSLNNQTIIMKKIKIITQINLIKLIKVKEILFQQRSSSFK